jgi:hypothetical protein
VGDQDRVVVGEQRAVVREEVPQRGHLLEVRRHARGVAREVRVVELQDDDVLDLAAGAEVARGRRLRR